MAYGYGKIIQYILEIDQKNILKQKDYYRIYNLQMNKTVILILIIGLTLSQCSDSSCQNGGGAIPIVQPIIPNPTPLPPPTTSSSDNSCQDQNQVPVSTLPVNAPITINTPTSIAPPPCAIETINPPTISAPVINSPTINIPIISVPTIAPPPVVAPPTVTPPTPLIPIIQTPTINAPPPPPINTPTKPVIPVPPILILPPAPQPVSSYCQSSSFTLSFQYACRQTIPFLSCQGQVVWNNNIIYSVVPSDYNIRLVSINITAVAGLNVLQFIGAGKSDSYGLGIDNIKLVRIGTTNNIVINGDFSSPNQYGSWSIQNNINGWTGIGIEVGQGTIYNSGWSSQICQLDGNSNYLISQSFTFDINFNLIVNNSASACNNPYPGKTLNYILQFDWAPRTSGISNLNTSYANIIWNNVVIDSLVPNSSTSAINHAAYNVVLNPDKNILQFDGTSYSDTYGVTITNVYLYSIYNSTNLINNGQFTQTSINAYSFNYINGGVPAWSAYKAEVGDCRIYNSHWTIGLCIELDSDSNQRYTQVITIPQAQYASLILYLSSVVGNGQVISNANLAINNANNLQSKAVSTINGAITSAISLTASKFNNYLNDLYKCTNAAVQNINSNAYLTISQYSTSSSEWIQYFGQSGELDFSCSGYSQNYLTNNNCTIKSIWGKVIQCVDQSGGNYHLQVSPCTHIEGQSALPQIGTKIFWKGTQGSSGNINVFVATSCNC